MFLRKAKTAVYRADALSKLPDCAQRNKGGGGR